MGFKSFMNKVGEGIKSGVAFVGDKCKQGYNGIKEKININKLEKEKREFLISQFEKSGKEFTLYFKDGKFKKLKCLYNYDEKTLKLNMEVDKEKIDYFEDAKHQKYYIQDIDLDGDIFSCQYNDEELSLPLEKIIFTTQKPVTPTINNYKIIDNSVHDNHSIKTKNSVINSDNSKVETESKMGININLPKP